MKEIEKHVTSLWKKGLAYTEIQRKTFSFKFAWKIKFHN